MEFPPGGLQGLPSPPTGPMPTFWPRATPDPALREEILAIDGVTDVVVTRQSLSLWYQLAGDASVHSTGMGDVLTQQNWDTVAAALLAGTMPEGGPAASWWPPMWRRPTREIAPGASLVVEGGGDPVTVTVAGGL